MKNVVTVVCKENAQGEDSFEVKLTGPDEADWDTFETDNAQEAIDEAEAMAAETNATLIKEGII